MKVKSWLKYLIYIILFLAIACFGQNFLVDIKKSVQGTENVNLLFLPVVITSIFYVVIGLLLGLESLICEIKKDGIWKINLPKLVLLGVPSLYISFYVFLYYSNYEIISNVLALRIPVLLRSGTGITFQVVLGYSIITSFYRKNEKME
jgi:hypothetical protein